MTQAADQVDPESEVHLIVRGFRIDLSLISNISLSIQCCRLQHFYVDMYEGKFSLGTHHLEWKLSDVFVIRVSRRFFHFAETLFVPNLS